MARIPNEEVRAEFRKILKGRDVNRKWMELIGHSQKRLEHTGGEIVLAGINYDEKPK